MSWQFSPIDLYLDVVMMKVHPPFFEPYGGTSSEESELDPSMATPTSSFVFPSYSTTVSSTMGSYVRCREDMDEASSTLARPRVGEDMAGVMDLGMSSEDGEMVSFPPRVAESSVVMVRWGE